MRRTFTARLMPVAVVATIAVACGGGAGTGSPDATTGSPPGATTSSSAVGNSVAVNLTFTGDTPLTAQGSAGMCQLGHGSDGSVVAFGFNATDADYQGIGENLNFSEDIGSHKLSMKWIAGGGLAWFGYMEGGVTIAPDHRSVALDADLPTTPGHPEHVRGTIVCSG
jgi:hypothetical protein